MDTFTQNLGSLQFAMVDFEMNIPVCTACHTHLNPNIGDKQPDQTDL